MDRRRDTFLAPPSARRKGLYFVVLVFASGFLLDVLFRGWLLATAQPWTPSGQRTALAEIASTFTEHVPLGEVRPDASDQGDVRVGAQTDVVHPYVSYQPSAATAQLERDLRTMSRDRGDEFVVLVLGGSVAGGFSYYGGGAFRRRLASDRRLANRPIRLLGYARGGHRQPQQVAMLAYLTSLGIEPGAVIDIDGFNEVAGSTNNFRLAAHPLHPSTAHWIRVTREASPESMESLADMRLFRVSALRWADAAGRFRLTWSAIAGRLAIDRVERLRHGHWAAYQRFLDVMNPRQVNEREDPLSVALRGPAPPSSIEECIEEIVTGWVQGSISLDAICRERSIPFLHVLQPTLHDEGSKPLTDQERRTGAALESWVEGVRLGYPRLRAAGAEISARGIAFLDASLIFESYTESAYFDACHFRGPSMDRFAERVADALLEILPPE